MARERASTERAVDAANELKAIRERVVALEKRLREQPTPEAVAELADSSQTGTQEPWPRDLNGQTADKNWGTDPEDLLGG